MMFNANAIYILEDAYRLIKTRIDWVQGTKFATLGGTPIQKFDKETIATIKRYSLDGAIHFAYATRMKQQVHNPPSPADLTQEVDFENAMAAVALSVKMEPATYNDQASTSHTDVLAAILQGIELLTEEQAKHNKEVKQYKEHAGLFGGFL